MRLGMILFIFARPLVGLYTNDPTVIALGVMCLRIIAAVQPMMASNLAFLRFRHGGWQHARV